MIQKKKYRRVTALILIFILIFQVTERFAPMKALQNSVIAYADGNSTEGNGKLTNGSFEIFANGYSWPSKDYDQPEQRYVSGWNTTAVAGTIELFKQNSSTYVSGCILKPTEGTYAAELNAEEESTLYQNVTTTPYSIYEWGLDHGARNTTDTMALVIGPSQEVDPIKPDKQGRDQLMQMVDWLINQGKTSVKTQEYAGMGEHIIVYSKKFGADGTFKDNEGNNAFSMTPSQVYTEEWHVWIMASNKESYTENGKTYNKWNSYGANAENTGDNTQLDDSLYYLYTVPDGQTKTLFGFVSVGCIGSTVSGDKKNTYGNFLDNINFEIFHPLTGSTTLHGSGVVIESDGTVSGGETSDTGYEVTVDNSLITYAIDGKPLKIQAVIKSEDAEDGCEFVGLNYTKQDEDGNPITSFLQKDGHEIDYRDDLTDEEKKENWIKSTSDGDVIYTYYLDNITTAIDLHFVFIKSPTVTYDPNGGKPYVVERADNTDEEPNVYSFKPVKVQEGETISYTFISPYTSKAPEGYDGWKFMGWLLTGDTVSVSDTSGIINGEELGTLLLSKNHTIACDYTVEGTSKEQYFKIWDKDITLENTIASSSTLSTKWEDASGNNEGAYYANYHKGLTMVAQWRWLQAFVPQVKEGTGYVDSQLGGSVNITSITNTLDDNYNASYNSNGGKSYYAEAAENITVEANANTGYIFEGWYDSDGNLLTTKSKYSYTENKEKVNIIYARFSGSLTQKYICQKKDGDNWTEFSDDSIGKLDKYSYTDVAGAIASSTATAGEGYRFVGWYDEAGNEITDEGLLSNYGATLSYAITEGVDDGGIDAATYYARFDIIDTIPINITLKWDDKSNVYSTRPSNVTLKLYADNDGDGSLQKVLVDSSGYTLNWDKTNSDQWTATITGLPRYAAVGTTQTEIVYSLVENDMGRYVEKISTQKPSGEEGEWKFTIVNTLDLLISLTKFDEVDNSPIQGTQFRLYKAVYDAATNTYTRKTGDAGVLYTTNSSGKISIQIQSTGYYELVEETASTGYELGDEPFQCFFKVADADLRQKLEISSKTTARADELTSVQTQPFFILQAGDELLTETGLVNVRKTGTLKIYKRDGDSDEALDGVKFKLYKQIGESTYDSGWEFVCGGKYTAFTSDRESTPGETTIEKLQWGNYKLVETVALDGYVLNSDAYFFTVDKNTSESPIELTAAAEVESLNSGNVITNYRNKIQFIKESEDGALSLTGGDYRIVKVFGENREEVSFYTDATGATGAHNRLTAGDCIYGLATGTYEIEELTPPYGYKLNSSKVAFIMDEYGDIRKNNGDVWSNNQVIMQDEPLKINIKKIDYDTNLTVEGAQFTVTGIFAENSVKSAGESSIYNLTADNFSDSLKGKLIASTGSAEGVNCFTYSLEESAAPLGYNLMTEVVKFRISTTGKIYLVNTSGLVNVDNEKEIPEIIIKNTREKCSFVVTKKFVYDSLWKDTIRPEQVRIQLYSKTQGQSEADAVGTPAVMDTTGSNDSFTYTYSDLPKYYYDNVGGVSTPKELSYYVREADVQPAGSAAYYRVEYSEVTREENTFLQTITNTAADFYPTGELWIDKTNIGGAMGAVFQIKVTLSYDGKENIFKDTYKVYKSDEDDDDSNDVYLRTETASDGYVKIKGGEYARLVLPKGVNYHIEENIESIGDKKPYTVTYVGQDGSIAANTIAKASLYNRANIYTAIENDTENKGNCYQDSDKPKNAGGIVGVVTDGESNEEAYDKVDYQEGKMSVFWMAASDWCMKDSFSITYREYDANNQSGVDKIITVTGFLNEDGTLKDVSDECYDELRFRYSDMEIEQNEDGAIILRLADSVEGMPYLSKVDVEFVPTVAIINTTEENVGGKVKAESGQYSDIADGKGTHGEKRYPVTKLYAKADEGYSIDLSEITIGNVGTIAVTNYMASSSAAVYSRARLVTNKEVLSLDNNNSFSLSLPYSMADGSDDYNINGRVVIENSRDDKPTEIVIYLEGLSIPVDVGVKFTKTVFKQQGEESGETIDEPTATGSTNREPFYLVLLLMCGLGVTVFSVKRRKIL